MHWVARAFIKTALFFFLAGFTLGGGMLGYKWWTGFNPPYPILVAHVHILSVGFIVMMIMGVAYWMFPQMRKKKWPEGAGWAVANYWLLTVGVIFRVLGEPWYDFTGNRIAWWMMGLSVPLQVGAAFVFAFNIWGRVRGFMSGRTFTDLKGTAQQGEKAQQGDAAR